MKKKLITIITTLVCVLCCTFALAACNGRGDEDIKDGNIHTYRENGVEYEFCYSGVHISGVHGSINERGIVIKGIKPDAGVTEISIPSKIGGEAVKIIEEEGAAAATGIKSVTVPDSVTVIISGFYGWSALESIELPYGLKYINYSVCMSTKIKSLTIPDSVVRVAETAFSRITELESVSAPAEMLGTFLNSYHAASYRSYIKTVNVTSGNEIYVDTFSGYSSLESVTIAESVNTIGDRAFKDLDSLTELNFLGTTAQWKQVRKGEDWDSGSYFVVNCSDGQVQ